MKLIILLGNLLPCMQFTSKRCSFFHQNLKTNYFQRQKSMNVGKWIIAIKNVQDFDKNGYTHYLYSISKTENPE